MLALRRAICLLLLLGTAYGKLLQTLRSGQLSNPANTETAEGANRLVCTIIGFDTAASTQLKRRIFSGEEFERINAVLREISSPEQQLSSELRSPVTITHLSRLDAISGGTRFLDQVAGYSVGLRKAQLKSAVLHIVVEDGCFGSEKAAAAWVRSAVNDASPQGRKINVQVHHVARSTANSEDACGAIRRRILQSLQAADGDASNFVSTEDLARDEQARSGGGSTAATATSAAKEKSRQVGKRGQEVKDIEVEAVLAASRYVQSFRRCMNTSIGALLQDGLVSSGSTVNSTVAALRSVLEGAEDEHRHAHAAELLAHGGSAAFQSTALQQCRMHLAGVMLPVYRTLTQSMLQGSLGAFDRQVGRLTSTRRLPAQLRLISNAVNTGFARGVEGIRSDFMAMIETTAAVAAGVDAKKAGNGNFLRLPQFSADYERATLKEELRQRSVETLNSLTLSGTYNPYVRETDLPPFHINVNYLVDPKALMIGQEYKSLYDEHREGPCETRADPLVFPGIATIPFDPNQHPVSTEKVNSWVDVVKDFFANKE